MFRILPQAENPERAPIRDEAWLNEDSDVIFDQDELHTFELWLPESSLASINTNPAA